MRAAGSAQVARQDHAADAGTGLLHLSAGPAKRPWAFREYRLLISASRTLPAGPEPAAVSGWKSCSWAKRRARGLRRISPGGCGAGTAGAASTCARGAAAVEGAADRGRKGSLASPGSPITQIWVRTGIRSPSLKKRSSKVPGRGRGNFEGRLVGFDVGDHFAFGDAVPFLLPPLRQQTLFHRVAEFRHLDWCGHFASVPARYSKFSMSLHPASMNWERVLCVSP